MKLTSTIEQKKRECWEEFCESDKPYDVEPAFAFAFDRAYALGKVWLNPPYSQPLLKQFVRRMADHNNGIALLYNRCGNTMFHDIIFPTATAMKFLRRRIRFYRPDGTQGGCPGCGSVLIAWGEDNARVIQSCELEGKVVRLNAPAT